MAPLKSTHTPASARQCLYARSPAVSKFRGRVKVMFWVYSPSQAMASISWLTCRRFSRLVRRPLLLQYVWAPARALHRGSARRAAEKTPLNRPRSSPEQQYFTDLDRADALVNTDTEYYCISVLHWARQSWCAGKHRHRVLLYISTSLS